MNNLTQRLITGTIFVIVLVGCMWYSSWSMAGLFLVITVLGLLEFYKLAEKANAQPLRIYGAIGGGLIIACTYIMNLGYLPILEYVYVPIIFLPFLIELFRKKENPFANIGWTLLGLIYVALPMTLLVATFGKTTVNLAGGWFPDIPYQEYDPRPVLTIFILIWVSDSMAYVCGRLFGKHKLWERISPKKTWEGFIGGLIFTVFTGGMIGNWVFGTCNYKHEITWIIVAFVISVSGMLGDLVESLFKRSIDVKDSGTILPGHGGILDRFDALFLAVPFALTAFWICGALFHIRLP